MRNSSEIGNHVRVEWFKLGEESPDAFTCYFSPTVLQFHVLTHTPTRISLNTIGIIPIAAGLLDARARALNDNDEKYFRENIRIWKRFCASPPAFGQ